MNWLLLSFAFSPLSMPHQLWSQHRADTPSRTNSSATPPSACPASSILCLPFISSSLDYLITFKSGSLQFLRMKVKVKVTQSYLTLCSPMDYTVHGILQVRILEWVAFPFSRGSSQPKDPTQVSHIAGEFFFQLSHKGSPTILE